MDLNIGKTIISKLVVVLKLYIIFVIVYNVETNILKILFYKQTNLYKLFNKYSFVL